MRITFDPMKRAGTLEERGIDFFEAAEVFAGVTLTESMSGAITARRALSPSGTYGAAW